MSSFCSDASVDAKITLHWKLFNSNENQKQKIKMKVLRHFFQIASLFLLLTVIVQSASTSTNAEGEVETRIVKRGIFDCPHDCWGDSCKWMFLFVWIGNDHFHFFSSCSCSMRKQLSWDKPPYLLRKMLLLLRAVHTGCGGFIQRCGDLEWWNLLFV